MVNESRVQSTHCSPCLYCSVLRVAGSPACLELQAQEQSCILKRASNQDTGSREAQSTAETL